MVWGTAGGGIKSCDSILKRIETNDPQLTELVILPMKNFGVAEVDRLAAAIANGTNTTLKSINASGHAISPTSSFTFASAIASANLTGGGVTDVAIGDGTMGDEGIVAFCKPLEESGGSGGGGLEVLDFSFKKLTKDGTTAINRAFGHSPTVRRLHLYRNVGIGDEGMETLCHTTTTYHEEEGDVVPSLLFPALEYLDLSDCSIGTAGVRSLVVGLLSDTRTDGGDDDDDDGAERLQQRRKPIDLTLSRNRIGPDACHHLARLMIMDDQNNQPSSRLLRCLNLQNCGIGDEGLRTLLCSIPTTTDAASNNISSSSSSSTTTLEQLDLTGNNITGVGGCMIDETVTNALVGLHLKNLILAHNPIGVEGILTLASSLNASTTTTQFDLVDLTKTDCGVDGALALLRCCSGTDDGGVSIQTLRLFDNELGSNGFEAFATYWTTTIVASEGDDETHEYHSVLPLPSVINLDIGGNRASEKSVVSLLEVFKTLVVSDTTIIDNNNDDGILTTDNHSEQQSQQRPLRRQQQPLGQLRTLEIGGNAIGEEAEKVIEELTTIWPELDVVRDKASSNYGATTTGGGGAPSPREQLQQLQQR